MSAVATLDDDSLVTLRREAVRRMWVRRIRSLAIATGLAFLFLGVPPVKSFVQDNAFSIGWALCSAMVGLSINVLVGYAGQISLAQAVLFGSGAYSIGHLTSSFGMPWLVSLPLAGLMTAAIALLIGFPALRVRGLNLAILTLGFQFVMNRTVFRTESIGGGAAGISITRPEFFGVSTQNDSIFLIMVLSVILVIWIVDRNLTRSRAGRAFYALRQDEQVAASFGIPVARYKLLAFAISGFYAGLGGALFGTLVEDVSNESFEFIFSIQFLVFGVLGGLGSRLGTSIGAAFPIMFNSLLDFLNTAGPVLGALLLVVTLLRYPGGIAAQGRELGHVARELLHRGFVYFLGFIAVQVISIAAAIGVPAGVIGLLGLLGWRLTILPTILIGLAVLTVLSQVLIMQLFKLSARRGHAPVVEAGRAAAGIGDPAAALAQAGTLTFKRAARTASGSGPLLSVENLAIRFGGVRALDGVSLEVREGELIGIMGPNGSGKTTMLNCISGFLTPNEGDISIRGRSILSMAPHTRAAMGLGRTFQHVGLVKQETVFDNFMIAQHLVAGYGALEGVARTGTVLREERRLHHRARAAIKLLGLDDIVGEKVASLPHGRAKLVELGCALVTGPELLLLDEPAAGVSPQEADTLGETLKQIAAHFGVTILMIEHHVPLMLSTCDYIYVLNFGQLLTHGEPGEVAKHPDVIAAYLGSVGKEASDAVVAGH